MNQVQSSPLPTKITTPAPAPFDAARVTYLIKNGRYLEACSLCEQTDTKSNKEAMYLLGFALKY